MSDPLKRNAAGETLTRHVFHLEVHGATDALARVLAPFAVQDVTLRSVAFEGDAAGARVRIEAGALDDQRTGVLVQRLRNLPVVKSVGFGWRSD